MENDDEGLVNIYTCELDMSSHIRASVNGKSEKFSFYMRSFVKKLFFGTWHVKFIGISRISPSQIN